jgi:dedicator of cytokinesis protein 5
MWEKAIKLSKELAETYESKVFDYEGLGSLLVSLRQQGVENSLVPSRKPGPRAFFSIDSKFLVEIK